MTISERPISDVMHIHEVSIAFEVKSVCRFKLTTDEYCFIEESIEKPYIKDYDSIPDNHPMDWAKEFDMQNWGLLFAHEDDKIIGSALIAYNTNGVNMLEGSSELAVLWDLRVAPKHRGKGVGRALFDAAKAWAKAKGCKELKIETQNNNVGALKFYFKQGAELRKVVTNAYDAVPGEDMLLFYVKI